MKLETTDILGCRRIGTPSQEGCEAPHEAYVVALRLLSQATHRHVFKHALPERADGLLDGWIGHRLFLSSCRRPFMLGARPGPAQPLISSLLAIPSSTPPQTPSREAGSYMGAGLSFIVP